MRNSLLFAFFWLAVQAQAQLYVPMPSGNVKWNQLYFNMVRYEVTLVQTAEDTIHNNLTYTTLYQMNLGYQGAMREDNQVIYFLPAGDTAEVVLYDFNVQVGDTVSHWWMQRASPGYDAQSPSTLIVSSIDSFLVNNSYRQRINITIDNSLYNTSVVSGIGNMAGPLQAWTVDHAEHNVALTCFRVNDIVIWDSGQSAGHCLDSAIVSVDKSVAQNFRFYPNPTAEDVFFEELEAECKVLIYNNLAQKVGETTVSPYQNKVPMQDLNAGLYYLHLIGADGRKSVEKVVKY